MMPRRPRNSPCGTGPSQAKLLGAHRFGEGGKVDLRGEVGFARRLQRIGVAVAADRLQRVAEARLGVAVVDEERGRGCADCGEPAGEPC